LLKFYQLAALAASATLVGCGGKTAKPIVVGSQNSAAQSVVSEIVAQHLEHRLARKVERNLGTGNELAVYQSLLSGDITVYPAFAGSIETLILREQPSSDPNVVWTRSQTEMSRTAKMDLFNPLGYENPPAMVIRPDAQETRATTLSEIAEEKTPWKIGVSYEFQQRSDALQALSSYKLPMAQAIRGMEGRQLFPALDKGDVTMIAADSTDGRLTSPNYRILADDKHAFPPNQACLLARQDALAAEPPMRAYLAELSGKFTTEAVRKMSAQVDLEHRKPAEVAAEFLSQAGFK
jgi:glycine betaine/choline ABC-type transport system substrate-binding protein